MRIVDPVAHFLSRAEPEPNTGCLLWTGATSHDGYAKAALDGRCFYVHRYLWEAVHGPIPVPLQLDHLCRVRHCIRLSHLEVVTGRTNLMRGSGVSAVNASMTACVHGHAFSAENVWWWRGHRHCRACHRIRQAARRERLRSGVTA